MCWSAGRRVGGVGSVARHLASRPQAQGAFDTSHARSCFSGGHMSHVARHTTRRGGGMTEAIFGQSPQRHSHKASNTVAPTKQRPSPSTTTTPQHHHCLQPLSPAPINHSRTHFWYSEYFYKSLHSSTYNDGLPAHSRCTARAEFGQPCRLFTCSAGIRRHSRLCDLPLLQVARVPQGGRGQGIRRHH
jgi:hypothetical protein